MIHAPYIQLLDEGKLQSVDDLYTQFENAESASKLYESFISQALIKCIHLHVVLLASALCMLGSMTAHTSSSVELESYQFVIPVE